MKVPSTLRCSPIGSWVGSVRLCHIVGWQKTLFLLDASIPLQGTSNGWRMTWSRFRGMRKLIWGLARRQGGMSDHPNIPHILLFCTFRILIFVFEFNKRLECSKSPMKTILLSYYLIYSFFLFFSFFLCHVIFSHDVPSRIFAVLMVFSPNFYLDHPFKFWI